MNENLKFSNSGYILLKEYEKFAPLAYKPTSNDRWTYGYGSTFKFDGSPVLENDSISINDANELLKNKITAYELGVIKRISIELVQCEFDSLVDLCYNAGYGYHDNNNEYHNWDLFHNINSGMKGNNLFNYWTTLAITQLEKKRDGLVRRRKSEVTLFLTGEINFFES